MKCKYCGEEYETTDQRRRYCSAHCAYLATLNIRAKYMRGLRAKQRATESNQTVEDLLEMITPPIKAGQQDIARERILDNFIVQRYNRK